MLTPREAFIAGWLAATRNAPPRYRYDGPGRWIRPQYTGPLGLPSAPMWDEGPPTPVDERTEAEKAWAALEDKNSL